MTRLAPAPVDGRRAAQTRGPRDAGAGPFTATSPPVARGGDDPEPTGRPSLKDGRGARRPQEPQPCWYHAETRCPLCDDADGEDPIALEQQRDKEFKRTPR